MVVMEKLLKKLPFLHKHWFQFLRFLTRHFFEDNCQQKAASLTYTTLLSIVPILTVLLMILSSVPALSSVRAQIYEVIYSNLLPQSSLQVSKYINNFAEKSSNLTIIGAMVLFGITLAKLFLYDIASLNTISKTIVFVSLGILLLVISFLYNKFKDKIVDDTTK